MLNEFLRVENMGLDTRMNTLGGLQMKIFLILSFDLINMLIRPLIKNATYMQISIQQFLSPCDLYIAFPS